NQAVTNQGAIFAEGTSSISGTFTVTGGNLTLTGTAAFGDAIMTVANGFTNSGAITLTSSGGAFNAALIVSVGNLANNAGGTINSQVGAGGQRSLIAVLRNQGGTVNIDQDFDISAASAAHLNTSTIILNTGNLTVNQSGASPSFTNQ